MTVSHIDQFVTTFSGLGATRRRFLTLVGGTAALGALSMATTGLAVAATDSASSQSGSLSGNHGGAYASYVIAAPSGKKLTVSLTFDPFHAGAAHRIGISVWQSGAKLGNAHGSATGLHDHTDSNTATLSVTPKAGEPVLVKVYNFSRTAITFTLTASEAIEPLVIKASQGASLESLGASAAGTLEGGHRGGMYAQYLIADAGSSKITLTLTYTPYDAIASHSVGFAVFENAKKVATAHGTATGLHDHTSSNVASTTVTAKSGQQLLIKVFNFGKDTISYTLTRS